MKKKYIIIIIAFTLFFFIMTSCAKNEVNKKSINEVNNLNENANKTDKENNTDKIQLWCYTHSRDSLIYDTFYMNCISKIVDSAKKFCEKNDIPLEVFEYDDTKLSFEDYDLKRSVAAASGNMIVVEDVYYIEKLAKQHADYSKIDNYKNLLDGYKDRFCIPLGIFSSAGYINNDAIQYYEIKLDRKVLTYIEYLEIKQNMKEQGAKFELNNAEFEQMINYFKYINGLEFINYKSKALEDNELFKKTLKKTILEICNDILLYYDDNLSYINKYESSNSIYDKNSEFILNEKYHNLSFILDPYSYNELEDITNKTFFIEPFYKYLSVNFFMYNKITNEKIYDLANHIISEDTYLMIMQNPDYKDDIFYYTPILNNDKVKETLGLNNELEFIKDYKGKIEAREIINDAYEILIKNTDTAKEIADYQFTNNNYENSIKYFIMNILQEIAKELSGSELSLRNFDPEDEKINKILDKKINDFVLNFNIHNN